MAKEFLTDVLDEKDFIPNRRRLLRQRAGLRARDSTATWHHSWITMGIHPPFCMMHPISSLNSSSNHFCLLGLRFQHFPSSAGSPRDQSKNMKPLIRKLSLKAVVLCLNLIVNVPSVLCLQWFDMVWLRLRLRKMFPIWWNSWGSLGTGCPQTLRWRTGN